MAVPPSLADAYPPGEDHDPLYKWKAFTAIGIAFVTQVMAMSMVFVALSAIADDFGVTLRAVAWVVIAQALTISALMMPMGRLADMVGWRRIHLSGLVLFGGGALATAFAPSFGLLIAARVVMATGNAMGQSVGTAMVVSVFPARERGLAIGSQTTAVSIGGAAGPIVGGLLLSFLPWEALFMLLIVPVGIAFVAGYLLLDDVRLRKPQASERPPFDYAGATLSALAIALLVLTMNNPLGASWTSPLILGSSAAVVLLLAGFVRWELRTHEPMLELRLFRNAVLSLAVVARFLGFFGATVTRLLMPIYLISLRGLGEGAAGAVLFIQFLGMGVAAQSTGRLADRHGARPFAIAGFGLAAASALPIAFLTAESPLWVVMVLLLINGVGLGTWNVPNNTVIMSSVPLARLGVVAAFTNLTRNVGNVTGQAAAAAIIAAVMAARGFDIPLSELDETAGAGAAFIDGWRIAYLLVFVYSLVSMAFAFVTKPAVLAEPAEEVALHGTGQVAGR